MVLEATMVIIDNSEYMRNGDYTPSRYQAQLDTVEIIFRRKTNSNPENVVGLMTMSGDSPIVLSNLTTNYGQILSGLHSSKIEGQSKLIDGIQVACLALRNRQNKNQRQRIIVFVGSPVKEDSKELYELAAKLSKNNIALDIINFGEQQTNLSKLEDFIGLFEKSGDNASHLVTVPQGPYLLYEQVDKTAILRDQEQLDNMNDGFGGDFGGMSGSGDGGEFDFGMDDPNMDPELAMAIRLSLEEENTRKEREAATTVKEEDNKVDNEGDEKMQED
ncbi:hypothetical protein C6P40_001541 [Pichia californica]|uniref:VWFA domain-containing protein n=1 Tax=Pichia californica TaxID=460514 RepID=A0A9P6WJC5_9ASCO|nr:hypothetical protein C6P42_001783 [[Candida] californica]KAG0688002.1 hypothetical protein C6P40_001541 [[Candida] californica]